MLRLIKQFALKTGLIYLMSHTAYVSLGTTRQLLLCILLITISTYIAEFISHIVYIHTEKSVYALFMTNDTKTALHVIGLIGILIFTIVIPIFIMNGTSGIQTLYGNLFIKFAAACIL